KIGDETRLTTDFKLAVQEAYDQALLCRRALLDRNSKLFCERQGDTSQREHRRRYILCITLDHYPAVMHPDFQMLVDQAKSTGEPRFTDVVFFLYDLAGKGADDLINTVKLLKRN